VKKNISCIAIVIAFFALCWRAEAQQPKKATRIGYLDDSTTAGSAELLEAFRKQMTQLGWVEGRISPSSTDLEMGKGLIASRRSHLSWYVSRLR
jgi:hypothetical protein